MQGGGAGEGRLIVGRGSGEEKRGRIGIDRVKAARTGTRSGRK